jgi:ParB family chromosome partitioning protein
MQEQKAESIRVQGVLSPLLVRPLNERSFEIVAGARRYRAAQMAEAETVPVRIVNLTDAEALEVQLVENLIRADVHPMEEANGFRALLNLEEPKYSIEQIAARTGKTPAFVASLCGQPHKAAYVVKLLMWRSVLRRLAKIQIKLESDLEE